MRLILFILLIGFKSFGQENDPLLPPSSEQHKVSQDEPVNLKWADSLIPQIAKIEFVQLYPLCEDEKTRKKLYNNKDVSLVGCYNETVLIPFGFVWDTIHVDSVNFILEQVPLSHTIDKERLYNWTEIDTVDFNTIFDSSFGLKESQIAASCYNPRHAIIYKNKEDSTLGIYEVCFECGRSKIYFNNIRNLRITAHDIKTIRELFMEYGFIFESKN